MRKELIEKELESDLMFYDTKQDKVHILNATARLVFKLHQEGRNLNEIEQEVKNGFQIKKDENIRTDIQNCIVEIEEKNLI